MKRASHTTAQPSHYDAAAEHYDTFNEANRCVINQTIATILKEYGATSVLDMTCGTGSQVFYLAKQGFKVVGSDINAKMLNIAKDKAEKEHLDIQFIQGDMRSLKVGTFDAVITIFNAIGHLTKSDFEKAIRNIKNNLKKGGIYIFDIFNLSYLQEGNNITNLTIDWQNITDDTKVRDIQYSTIDDKGILASYSIHSEQRGSEQLKISESEQTLQVYTAQQLKGILNKHGFQVLRQCDVDASPFHETSTESILTVAQKR
jgi:2-polyprenyl-3-methyl-5-hydroxy-6-metoxy-1,4-benzoquinol methylase